MPNPFLGLRSGLGSPRKGFYYGDNGPARSDQTTQAIAEMLRQQQGRYLMDQQQHEMGMRTGGIDPMPGARTMRGGGNRLGNIFAGGDNNGGQMDVVYDQRPEMFTKQLNFAKDQAAQQQKNIDEQRRIDALKANDEYIDTRRKNEMAGRDMTLKENVANYGMMNPNLEIKAVPGGNIVAINPKTGQVVDTGQGSGEMSDADKMSKANEYSRGQIELRNQGDAAAAQIRANATMQPNAGEMGQRTLDKARELILTNPAYAKLIQFSDDGKSFSIRPQEERGPVGEFFRGPAVSDDEVRRNLAKELYGDRNVPSVGGVGSAALGGSPGSAGVSGDIASRGNGQAPHIANPSNLDPVTGKLATVIMERNGKRIIVPANKVQEAEKRGAKRIQ